MDHQTQSVELSVDADDFLLGLLKRVHERRACVSLSPSHYTQIYKSLIFIEHASICVS